MLESTTALVEDGSYVLTLDWDIEPGLNYGLRCTSEDPQLWREGTSSTLNYPYEVGDLLTITNSTAGPSLDYYYFFYEWVAEPKPIECVSDRIGVTVTVEGTSMVGDAEAESISVWPNPVQRGQSIQVSAASAGSSIVVLDAYGKRVFDGLLEGALSVDWPAGWYTVCVKGQGDAEETRLPLVVR